MPIGMGKKKQAKTKNKPGAGTLGIVDACTNLLNTCSNVARGGNLLIGFVDEDSLSLFKKDAVAARASVYMATI